MESNRSQDFSPEDLKRINAKLVQGWRNIVFKNSKPTSIFDMSPEEFKNLRQQLEVDHLLDLSPDGGLKRINEELPKISPEDPIEP